jgi:hypothetical protein
LTLGGGGLFLEGSLPVPRGDELTVRFRPAKHLPVIEARARVLYESPGEGTGIEFVELKQEDRERILHLLVHRFSDKRKNPRIEFVTQVEHESGTSLGFSRDLSIGGMFIASTEPLLEGTKVQLRFHMDDGGPIIETPAEVRFVVEKVGMGLSFLDLSPEDADRVAARIASAKEAPTP